MIGVMGERYWAKVALEMFQRANVEAEIVPIAGRAALPRWLLSGAHRRYSSIHHLNGPCDWRMSLTLGIAGLPVVWHWIGSDVVGYEQRGCKGPGRVFNRRMAASTRCRHLADSPKIMQELATLGIASQTCRLLPSRIEAAVEPLPDRFTVLSYWSDQRMHFYGGEIVFQLADAFPEVPFKIVGAAGKGVTAPANVEFLGKRSDMDRVYRESSLLIRMPEHDSLSAMVLEMLARGRYVIYNTRLDGCAFATTYEAAKQALEILMKHQVPNREGAEMVSRDFSIDREAAVLAEMHAVVGGTNA